jgi:hypothetical protein
MQLIAYMDHQPVATKAKPMLIIAIGSIGVILFLITIIRLVEAIPDTVRTDFPAFVPSHPRFTTFGTCY